MQSPKPPPAPLSPSSTTTTTTTFYGLLATSIFSLLFMLSLSISHSPSPPPPSPDPSLFPTTHPPNHRLLILNRHQSHPNDQSPPIPPSIAYLISGSINDSRRILRLLFAVYHPKNQYLLHLDLNAPQSERDFLAITVQSVPVFKAAQNVNVIGKADFAYSAGSSSISATLHGASVLLRISANWDWFINLSAADYPLVTQDGIIATRRLKPIIVDPGLYLAEKNEMFYATQKRELPDAYSMLTSKERIRLMMMDRIGVLLIGNFLSLWKAVSQVLFCFSGSSSAILSRKFIDHCILGTENLPRSLLMYLSNTPSSQNVYFPTILCNSRQFHRTIINHSLHYASFDTRQTPHPLNSSYFNDLVWSGAVFALPFLPDDPILDRIDQEILRRSPGKPVPGGWCLGESENDTCTVWGDADVLRPGAGVSRLEKRIIELLSNGTFQSHKCAVE
ncbi:unnamed protein product [Ilex paraguariensis]|uniref:Uncharacterized protein n=1 Tax=Ilex paraguariensis TaxID=185542 RepID=A0ABC8T9E4_9AQUA